MLITDFKSYIDELKSIEKRKKQIVEDVKMSFRINIENEFSKHLETLEYKDSKIFLIDYDFGIRVGNPAYNDSNKSIYLHVNTVYKKEIENHWVSIYENNMEGYDTNSEETIDAFVDRYIKKIKKYNIKRSLNRDKKRLKRDLKKYNI